MKLYHCRDARSFRALWTLEELGAAYELVNMPFPPRAAHPGYLAINPLGTVPTLKDGEVTLTESAAICQYLVERRKPNLLGVEPNEPAYGAYLNWLHRSDATLTFPLTLVLRYTSLEPPERRLPQAVEDYSIWFLSRLRSVETALEEGSHLCAGRFTAADIAVHYALMLGHRVGLEARYKPRCRDYYERLMERPAFKRAQMRQQ